MTYDELLKRVNPDWDEYVDNSKYRNALRAVVELHKPRKSGYSCGVCYGKDEMDGLFHLNYPCPTIQAIEKELS